VYDPATFHEKTGNLKNITEKRGNRPTQPESRFKKMRQRQESDRMAAQSYDALVGIPRGKADCILHLSSPYLCPVSISL
jgi:hypothetical protein